MSGIDNYNNRLLKEQIDAKIRQLFQLQAIHTEFLLRRQNEDIEPMLQASQRSGETQRDHQAEGCSSRTPSVQRESCLPSDSSSLLQQEQLLAQRDEIMIAKMTNELLTSIQRDQFTLLARLQVTQRNQQNLSSSSMQFTNLSADTSNVNEGFAASSGFPSTLTNNYTATAATIFPNTYQQMSSQINSGDSMIRSPVSLVSHIDHAAPETSGAGNMTFHTQATPSHTKAYHIGQTRRRGYQIDESEKDEQRLSTNDFTNVTATTVNETTTSSTLSAFSDTRKRVINLNSRFGQDHVGAISLISLGDASSSAWDDDSVRPQKITKKNTKKTINNKTNKNSDQEDQLLIKSSVKKDREIIPLGFKEDKFRLSEFLSFLRNECIEVFTATEEDVMERLASKRITLGQVGIRCRFCAHLSLKRRASRSSTFPSSISGVYQSVSMMIYKHFSRCVDFPPEIRMKYNALKETTKRGDVESRSYWIESAKAKGMIDTPAIVVSEDGKEGVDIKKKHELEGGGIMLVCKERET